MHHYPEEKPPIGPDGDMGDFGLSVDVLATDGKTWWHAYLMTWKDEAFAPQWCEVGRDGYRITANITQWTELPPLP